MKLNKPVNAAALLRPVASLPLAQVAGYTHVTLKLMVVRAALLSIIMCFTCSAYAAAPTCDDPALRSPGYARSTKLVGRLPELVAWSRSHKFPVAYGASMDKQELLHGNCYWSVSVYADRPERLELWQVFYVEIAGKHLLVQDPVSGEGVSLRKWRSTKKRT